MGKASTTGVNRKSLLSALCLLGGATLIAVGWWDYANPNVINQWWAGESISPFFWERLARTLALVLPLALLAWWLGVLARAADVDAPLAQRRRRTACGFAAGFAVPLILLLKYRVTWLGMNYGSSIWTYAFILLVSAVLAWLIWPVLRNQRLLAWLDRQGPLIVFTGILVYIIVYGGLAIARHNSFRTQALDLGSIDQAIWNTSRGRLLEYSPMPLTFGEAAPDLSPRSRLADGRLELILVPLSALYWVWADPRPLLALQAILLAVGAIPLYLLARTELDDSAASLAISLAYLLYMPLHVVTLSGFNPSVLMIPFLLWAWQAAGQRRWRSYYLAAGIALLCGIDAALVLPVVGFYFLVKGREYRLHGALTLLLSLAWLALNFGLVVPWAREMYAGPGGYPPVEGDLSESVWGLLSRPRDALSVLLEREKLQAVVDLLAALGGIPLLAPIAWLPVLPALVYDLLALSPFQEVILARDVAPVVPFVFVAAVLGAVYAGRWVSRFPRREATPGPGLVEGRRLATLFALTTAFLIGLFLSPLPPGWGFRSADYYQVSGHQRALAHTLDLIPTDAVVSAQDSLFPHLSRRPVIYLFPTLADAEYVVLDLDHSADKTPLDEALFSPTVDGLLASPDFYVIAFDAGALLLGRGSGQAPPAFAQTLADYRTGLYRSAIVKYRGPLRLKADNMYEAVIVLENRGTQNWQTAGLYPINLSYHWWGPNDTPVEWYGLLTPLGQVVKPGDVLSLPARFVTPPEPGDYVLEWDLVHERRTWFGDQGGITLRVDVLVE